MKSVPIALVFVLSASLSTARASTHLVPAGSLINCTISEPRINSKTTAIGDPVMCQMSMSSRNGTSRLPFDSYLEGRFEDFRDPGHFVGKGWMELKFDRMVVEPNTVLPVSARVVDVPGYYVDRDGRILGKGHRVRDIVEWSIPILWPIDLINLPRRGPRPTLKSETRLTLKVMDDMEIPDFGDPDRDPSGLYRRQTSSVTPPPDYDEPQQQQAEDPPAYQPPPPSYQQPPAYQQQQAYQPPPPAYYPQPVMPVYAMPVYMAPPPTVYVYSAPPPPPVHVYLYPAPSMPAMWARPGPMMVYPPGMSYRASYGYPYVP